MSQSEPARTTACRTRSPTGITIYGCGPDEAALFRRTAPRFGVLPMITDAAASTENAALATGNRCVSVDHRARLGEPVLLALSRVGVEYVSTRSVGDDHIDVEYARSVGITVGNVTYSPDSVADYTVMLMLMAVRNARAVISRVDAHDYRLNEVRGKELRDLTVGIVGTGRIGTAVRDRLRGFGCRILAYDNAFSSTSHVSAGRAPFAGVGREEIERPPAAAEYVPLDDLLRLSDIVTLHTPLTAQTHHLLDRRRIARLKNGAYVVNTGRGSLVDTEALIAALEHGRLGGAALDVLEGEDGIFYADRRREPIESKPLLRLHQLPNVVITPHTAYYTDHALRDTVQNTLANCVNYENGKQHG